MTHTITPSPEQWTAIQRGEGIEIVERAVGVNSDAVQPIKLGPDIWAFSEGRTGQDTAVVRCPYALDDRIAVVCPECGGTGQTEPPGVFYSTGNDGEHRLIACLTCSDGSMSSGVVGFRVTSITPREIDGVWCWVTGLRGDKMKRRDRIEQTLERGENTPQSRWLTDVLAELRALWAIVKAAQTYRRARQEESGQAIAERELCEALDAYEERQDG